MYGKVLEKEECPGQPDGVGRRAGKEEQEGLGGRPMQSPLCPAGSSAAPPGTPLSVHLETAGKPSRIIDPSH